jgi:predicted enzyme related to lactoylglutathione lyase
MPGKLVHFELPAEDAARARDFWSGVFGWSFTDPGMPGIEYFMVRTSEEQGGAVYPSQQGESGPIVYFDTDEIDESLAKIRELGGEAEDKQPIPGVGWFARCKDTEGNAFSLYQSDPTVPPEPQGG